MEQRLVSPEHQKWLLKLMGYQFEIQYQLRLENKAVDALSRVNQLAALLGMTVLGVIQLEQLAKEVKADLGLRKIIQEI